MNRLISLSLELAFVLSAILPSGTPLVASPVASPTSGTQKPVLIDPTFNPRLEQSEKPRVDFVSVQTDGKIIISGNFDTVNGSRSPATARLNPDGSLDPTGVKPPLQQLPKSVSSNWYWSPETRDPRMDLIPLPNGKFLITNPFDDPKWYLAGLARLNSDGSLDDSFQTRHSERVHSLTLQPDGKILISGGPTGALIRLNVDGSPDPKFVLPIPESQSNNFYRIEGLALQSNGQLIVWETGGGFNTTQWWRLSRRQPDGALDPTFKPPTRFSSLGNYGDRPGVRVILIDHHQNVLLFGRFPKQDGSADGLIRLKPDGSVDDSFQIGFAGDGDPYEQQVLTAAFQPDGNLIVGGTFHFVNGMPRTGLVRLFEETPPGFKTFAWAKPAIFVTEGMGAAEISVERFGDISAAATIDYTTRTGTALADSDFEAQRGLLRFQPGEQARRLVIPVHDSRRPAPDRTFFVDIAHASEGSIVMPTVAITILDQDRPGTLDLSFNADRSVAADFYVGYREVLAVQADGNLLVRTYGWDQSAAIENYYGGYVTRLERLKQDGALDSQFRFSALDNSFPRPTIAIQSDGKLVVLNSRVIQRLNKDGSPDNAFRVFHDDNTYPYYATLALDANGDILVGGRNLMRLKNDGIPDPSLNAQINIGSSGIHNVLAQADGRILITGDFTRVGEKAFPKIARLERNGNLDLTFVPMGAGINELVSGSGYIDSMILQPDGKILVACNIPASPPTPETWRIVRLETNGSVDKTFMSPGFDSFTMIALQPNGKIIVGGPGSSRFPHGLRLNSDGSLDPGFSLGSATIPPGSWGSPTLDAFNGKVLFSGGRVLLPDGSFRRDIFRLNLGSDLPILKKIRRNSSEIELQVTTDPGQLYTLEWSSNLETWAPLATNTATTSHLDFVDREAAASHRFYRVRSAVMR